MMREPPFSLLPRPTPMRLAGKRVLVLGLGDTGLSVARWVEGEGGKARVADTRHSPPRRSDYAGEFHGGPFDVNLLADVDLVSVSPGIPISDPLVAHAVQRGIPVVGDIELFAWQVKQPVLAVTGTNGKTTVTSLTGHLLRAAGMDCEVAGNIGPAVLQALAARRGAPSAWVLELSSYQLETTWSLCPTAASMLNLTEDHLDRYADLAEYGAAKARVFHGAAVQVLNRDDPRSLAMALPGRPRLTFGLDVPRTDHEFGLREGKLARGTQTIVDVGELRLRGWHNVSNALAACALASKLGVDAQALARGLATFEGLPHRLQLVAKRAEVEWYDDSKGTNVGATVAALNGLAKPALLILGGDGKGQDFSPLAAAVSRYARHVLLIGRDAPIIEKALAGLPTERCPSLEDAVLRAAAYARPGEAVLLSPACASFDMFRDYKHRGEVFAAAVKALSS